MSLEALPFVRHIVYNVAHQICNGYYRKILFGRGKTTVKVEQGEKKPRKKLLEGVAFNYKRRVVKSSTVVETLEHHEILRDTCNFHVKAPK